MGEFTAFSFLFVDFSFSGLICSFLSNWSSFLILFLGISSFLIVESAKLILDEEETQLKPFDVVVQRGTNHAWVCTSDEPALFIAVLMDADNQ